MKKSTRIVGKLRGLSIAFGVALIALSPVWCNLLYQWGTSTTVRITVTGKERVTFSTGSGENRKTGSKYLVFTGSETFENTDAWLSGKFASSDLQGKLELGKSYTVRVYGWRIAINSQYRNIIRIEE